MKKAQLFLLFLIFSSNAFASEELRNSSDVLSFPTPTGSYDLKDFPKFENKTIRTIKEWNKFWKSIPMEAPAPPADFQKEMLFLNVTKGRVFCAVKKIVFTRNAIDITIIVKPVGIRRRFNTENATKVDFYPIKKSTLPVELQYEGLKGK